MNNIVRKFCIVFLGLGLANSVFAQMPGGMPGARGGARGGGQNMNMGHMYGKVVDSKTNHGIDAATVQLTVQRFDTAMKKMRDYPVATMFTGANGDFSLENLPLFGKFKLRITNVGYKDYDASVAFNLKMPAGGGSGGQGDQMSQLSQMAGMTDRDLGNIKLVQSDANLGNVTVTSTAKPFFEMGVDRKVFNVDKNLVSTGQTATEVMKQIPSVNVDIDGNVTLRNAAPQLFVDGRPTTLTMDQIPSDIIDRVELITNPSAKFDASGGNGGIINIVLKKNRKTGYNGGIRAGVDKRGKINAGVDLNYRQGKINFFLNGNYNQRESHSTSYTDRTVFATSTSPAVHTINSVDGINNGSFAFARAGFDYFMDNRNTVTVTGTIVRGSFDNTQPQRVDSTIGTTYGGYSNINSASQFTFRNLGGQLSFKHNFTGNNHDITADINYNGSKNDGSSNLNTYTFTPGGVQKYNPTLQNNANGGHNYSTTFQSDYENQITDNTKLEAGVRGRFNDNENLSNQFLFDYPSNSYKLIPLISSNYRYKDQVLAAYGTYSFKTGTKWNYQLGLRAESSKYDGTLIGGSSTGKDTSFSISYPVSLFPSAFITYKISDKADLQINYSRRINRPNFFQLLPVTDISDPQNPRKGNPALKPEFGNSFEVSYSNNYARGANLLITGFFKYNTDLITQYLYRDHNPLSTNPLDSSVFSTYVNANNSITYGLEITDKMTFFKIWDATLNVNLYNSRINSDNLKDASDNERLSWFAKFNNNFKLPKNFSIQFSANYQAKTVLPQNSGQGGRGGGGMGGGGGFMGGGNLGTSQGYVNAHFGSDIAIRKDFTWKGGNSASITLSVNDVFRTERYSTYTLSSFLVQTQDRYRDPQMVRLNFSYRFGKFDVSLFKRKNAKGEMENATDMMGGGGGGGQSPR